MFLKTIKQECIEITHEWEPWHCFCARKVSGFRLISGVVKQYIKRPMVHTNAKWKEKCQESKQRIGKNM